MEVKLREILALSIDTGKIRECGGWQGKLTKVIAAVIALSVIYSNTVSELGILTLTVIFLSQMLLLTFLAITPLSSIDSRSHIG
ncbi:MAG: hypothetical protein HKN08_01190, partial [Gammaproteobacteria bacterium]|nr:hypothetical protein [Gammaproteobacteria bacterium]